jgi:exopolyphosphatase/guanosine-5'-triphosphate,3'-diphosphate pyrophosphatase
LPTVRRACIDIGSNTTRLLVADGNGVQLTEVHQERAFTRIGRGVRAGGTIAPAKIADVVEVVLEQLRTAHRLGAQEVRAVATAAIRQAANGAALVEAIQTTCGIGVDVLSGEEEARLAFVGAARTLDHPPAGELGVVDVGGGSSELVVGRAPDQVSWCTSFEIGSGDLADGVLRSDPPSLEQLAEARRRVAGAVKGLQAPHPAEAVAVGGSATSLRQLAGPLLDAAAFARSQALLSSRPAAEVAKQFGLERERVRLLPAGLLILEAASEIFGTSLRIARGGVREGVLLEASE